VVRRKLDAVRTARAFRRCPPLQLVEKSSPVGLGVRGDKVVEDPEQRVERRRALAGLLTIWRDPLVVAKLSRPDASDLVTQARARGRAAARRWSFHIMKHILYDENTLHRNQFGHNPSTLKIEDQFSRWYLWAIPGLSPASPRTLRVA
jgi:hypothetical protein